MKDKFVLKQYRYGNFLLIDMNINLNEDKCLIIKKCSATWKYNTNAASFNQLTENVYITRTDKVLDYPYY